jgi:hypothetical protein
VIALALLLALGVTPASGQAPHPPPRQKEITGSTSEATITLSPQQKAVLKAALSLSESNLPPKVVKGLSLPRNLDFHFVPPAAAGILPELRDLYYLRLDDRVILVQPGTYEVVHVLSLR